MLINEKVLRLYRATSSEKDEQRACLRVVCLHSDGSGVATDGELLVSFRPNEGGPEASDYPALKGMDSAATLDGPCLIPVLLAKETLRNIPKKSYLPLLTQYVAIEQVGEHVKLGTTDAETERVLVGKVSEGTFPNWEQFTDPRPGERTISFRVRVLEKMLATLKDLGVESFALKCLEERDYVRVLAVADGGTVRGAVMPCVGRAVPQKPINIDEGKEEHE